MHPIRFLYIKLCNSYIETLTDGASFNTNTHNCLRIPQWNADSYIYEKYEYIARTSMYVWQYQCLYIFSS